MIDFSQFPAEAPFAFRKALDTLHKPNRREASRPLEKGEIEITEEWKILLKEGASGFLRDAACDLQDYFLTSMELSLEIRESAAPEKNSIFLESGDPALSLARSFLFSPGPESITISGKDERGTAMGCYFLEDILNLRENPFYTPGEPLRKEPLFSPRIVHSGYGLDMFTLPYLRKIAHSGMDAVAVYIDDMEQDLNPIIEDGEKAGIDVYLYSHLSNPYHPDAPEAKEYYRNTYGRLFQRHPKARGIIFVGESICFPSKDPDVFHEGIDNEGERYIKRWSSGWPCIDYPQFMSLIKECIHEYSPQADIMFWTYNFGHAPFAKRQEMIRNLPDGLSINVNFALLDQQQVGTTIERSLDYTLGPAGPSKGFLAEAQAVAERGLPLYALSNTGGKTWDFGVIPYIPAPYQWLKRCEKLLECREKYHLQGLLESHHYGFQPSLVSEMIKWVFWSNAPDQEELLHAFAVREGTTTTAETLISCWKKASKGIAGYPTPIEDQYGPARVGPAYPLYFTADMLHTYYGKMEHYPRINMDIVFPWYRPVEDPINGCEGAVWRLPAEIRYMADQLACWQESCELLEKVISAAPERKKNDLLHELSINRFICHTLTTTRHLKKWFLLNAKLLVEEDVDKAEELLQKLEAIVEAERENTLSAIPLVRYDSRLGFECAMGYAGDEWHLNWKLGLLTQLAVKDLPDYRRILNMRRERTALQ